MQNHTIASLILALFGILPNGVAQGLIGSFSGTVSGVSGNTAIPTGTTVTGHWTFGAEPAFTISVGNLGTFILPAYEISVGNDSEMAGFGGLADSYMVGSYAIDPTAPIGLEASFALSTSDLRVFSGSALPSSLPPVSTFDLYNNWYLSSGPSDDPAYWIIGGRLDSISITAVPEPSTQGLFSAATIVFLFWNTCRNRQRSI